MHRAEFFRAFLLLPLALVKKQPEVPQPEAAGPVLSLVGHDETLSPSYPNVVAEQRGKECARLAFAFDEQGNWFAINKYTGKITEL